MRLRCGGSGFVLGVVLMLLATGAGVVAYGPAVAAQDQPQAATGTLTITTRQCPSDSALTPSAGLDALNTQCQVVSQGIDFRVTAATGAGSPRPLTVADATRNGDGSLTWRNLPFATYQIEQTKLPAGTTVFLVSPHLAVPGPFSVVIGKSGQPQGPANSPNQQLNLYDFPVSSFPGPIGQIVIHVYACPVGQNPDNVDPSTCTNPAPAGYDFRLTSAAGDKRTVADAPGGVNGDGFFWPKLAFGTYHLTQTTYGNGFDAYWIKPGEGISGSPDKGYDLAVAPGAQTLNVHAYEFQQATPNATGVIRVTVHLCPPGMDLRNLDRSQCQVTRQGFDFRLSGQALPHPYTLADALAAGDGAYAWQQLPFGAYHIAQTRFPAGYTTYWIETSAETGGGPTVGYDTAVAAESPARNLQVYDFAPGGSGDATSAG